MILAQAAARLQELLNDLAEQAAWDSGTCQRTSPLSGATLVQTLVLGALAQPDAALEDLAQTAALLGHPVSPQAIDQRFTPPLARCLERLLGQAVRRAAAAPATAAVLRKFAAVLVQDSTTVTLPDALAAYWRGCGTKTGTGGEAAVKFQVRLDLASGQLCGLAVEQGRDSDQATPLQTADLRPGELHLRDLGYFDLDVLHAIAAAGAFYLTRVQDSTGLYTTDGQPLALAQLARHGPDDVLDQPVQLGSKQRLAARLVMVRVPPDVAAARRRALRAKAKKKGYTPSADKLALCAWNVYVTNVPATRLDVAEVLALARARWQVECLFRHWKSDGRLAQWRSRKPWRVVSGVFARLLALVLGDSQVQAVCGGLLGRSLRRAWRAVRRLAGALAGALGNVRALVRVLGQLRRSLRKAARLEKRRRQPSTAQILNDPHRYGHKVFAPRKKAA
jgi:Transposase DDE domain